MDLRGRLAQKWIGVPHPVIIQGQEVVFPNQIFDSQKTLGTAVSPGDVVALEGDFDAQTISTLIELISLKAIVVPLTRATRRQHPYLLEAARVEKFVANGEVEALRPRVNGEQRLIDDLRKRGNAGLVLFSTGTTGSPKAILHDFDTFLERFETPRPTLRTLNFLLFDHVGGLNTLFHALFNKSTVVAAMERDPSSVLELATKHEIQVLPTTPTFLRLLLMSGAEATDLPESLRVISYGTERMDSIVLNRLNDTFPHIEFRQTYGMTELGILRVKSESSRSLYMKVGGEGVQLNIDPSGQLMIKSEKRMLGYLNAPSPFDKEGWYPTGDLVETKGEFIRVVGRVKDMINVGGLKVDPSKIEEIALSQQDVIHAKCFPEKNPVTGEHVELQIELREGSVLSQFEIRKVLEENLLKHEVPMRIHFEKVSINHRYKRV